MAAPTERRERTISVKYGTGTVNLLVETDLEAMYVRSRLDEVATMLAQNDVSQGMTVEYRIHEDLLAKWNEERIRGNQCTEAAHSSQTSDGVSVGTKWSDKETKRFIQCVQDSMDKLDTERNKQPVWTSIAKTLQSGATGKQCEQKWNNLKRAYRNAVQYEDQSGKNTSSFPFLDTMAEILGDDPATKPVYTASSTGKKSQKTVPNCKRSVLDDNDGDGDGDDYVEESAETPPKKGKKRKSRNMVKKTSPNEERDGENDDYEEPAETPPEKSKKRKSKNLVKKTSPNEELIAYLEKRDEKLMEKFSEFQEANINIMNKLVEKM